MKEETVVLGNPYNVCRGGEPYLFYVSVSDDVGYLFSLCTARCGYRCTNQTILYQGVEGRVESVTFVLPLSYKPWW